MSDDSLKERLFLKRLMTLTDWFYSLPIVLSSGYATWPSILKPPRSTKRELSLKELLKLSHSGSTYIGSLHHHQIKGITVFKIFIWGGISSDIRSEI